MSDRARPVPVQSLTHVDVSCSGEHIELGFIDQRGQAATLYLPQDCLLELLQLLPAMLQEALERHHGAASRRALYPLADWQLIEAAPGRPPVLSLTAADGFTVSFAMTPEAAATLGEALRRGAAPRDARGRDKTRPRLNH